MERSVRVIIIFMSIIISSAVFSQNKHFRIDSIYQKHDKNDFIESKIYLNNIYDSCYIHFYKSRAYFQTNQLDKSKSELMSFIEIGKTLPDFEDLAALGWSSYMCMLFMEKSRVARNKDGFEYWKKLYSEVKPSIRNCVNADYSKNSISWVFQEMRSYYKNNGDMDNQEIYEKKLNRIQKDKYNYKKFWNY